MEIYSHCTSTEFKRDISELCPNCPLTELINEGIKNQILFQALEQKEILTDKQFKKYINAEIKNAKDAMQNAVLNERQFMNVQNDPYRVNRSRSYIWNKERIKALNNISVIKLNENLELQEKSKKVIEGLNKYKFRSFIKQKGFEESKIYSLINNHSGKELMPYTIALLNELKFLSYFFNEFHKNKTEGINSLKVIFEVDARRIKGNVNILNPKSTEDEMQYTSHLHTENIQKELKGL